VLEHRQNGLLALESLQAFVLEENVLGKSSTFITSCGPLFPALQVNSPHLCLLVDCFSDASKEESLVKGILMAESAQYGKRRASLKLLAEKADVSLSTVYRRRSSLLQKGSASKGASSGRPASSRTMVGFVQKLQSPISLTVSEGLAAE